MAWVRTLGLAVASGISTFAVVRILGAAFSAPSTDAVPPGPAIIHEAVSADRSLHAEQRSNAHGGPRPELVNNHNDPPPLPPIHVSDLTPFQRRVLQEPRAAAWTKRAVINALSPVIRDGRSCFVGEGQRESSLLYVLAVRSKPTRATVTVSDIRTSAGAPLSSPIIDCLKKRATGEYTASNDHPDVPELRFLNDDFEMELPAPGGSLLGPL
jgi:hypothetical protein